MDIGSTWLHYMHLTGGQGAVVQFGYDHCNYPSYITGTKQRGVVGSCPYIQTEVIEINQRLMSTTIPPRRLDSPTPKRWLNF
jgi:hypothetical protein